MENLVIATAQFENASGDKAFNLAIIDELAGKAAAQGAKVIAFHECSVTGYSFARKLTRDELFAIAEPIPDGPSIGVLTAIARKYDMAVLAGLFERDGENIFKAYVCVGPDGLIAKHRKIHPFINPHILP